MTAPPPISCVQVVELVTEHLEGTLEPADRLAFERHVVICPPCRGFVTQLRRTIEIGRTVPAEELSPELQQRLVGAFRDWKRERGASE